METFQDYSYYYNLFYKDKNYKEEVQIISTLFPCDKEVHDLLNLGCGTGRHDLEFAKLGYSVTGVDMSSQMVEIAKENCAISNSKVTFEVADIRDYVVKKKYDIVTSLFHVMSYQNTNEDFLKVLHTVSDALNKGGYFIFDIWYGPGVLTDKPSVRIKSVEDEVNLLYRIARPEIHVEENVVDVNYEVLIIEKETGITKRIEEVHKMRYFFIPEIKHYLEEMGFELIKCIDCNTLSTTDFDSWTAYCIARKK